MVVVHFEMSWESLMISFKQFIQEKALNPSTFADTLNRLSGDALLGFELELWVNHESDLFTGDDAPSAHFVLVNKQTDVESIKSVFSVSRADDADMTNKYLAWEKGYFEDNPDGDPDFTMWLKADYGDTETFVAAFNLEPKYGWADESKTNVFAEELPDPRDARQTEWNVIADEVAPRLADALGVKVHVGYRGKNDWIITSDGSISGDMPGGGIEVVSPPEPADVALEHLYSCFKFIDKHSIITNSSTGLHINISIPDLQSKLDPLKLIAFMGEDHVLDAFSRTGNTYATTHGQDILDAIDYHGVPPAGSDILAFARKILNKQKYKTVNLSKLEDGYLEFRAAGGENYHADWTKISNTIGRFLTVLELACDPDAGRKEYVKKVAKLIGQGGEKNRVKAENLKTLILRLPSIKGEVFWPALEEALKDPVQWEDRLMSVLRQIIIAIGRHVDGKNFEPNEKTIAEFKQALGKINKVVPGFGGRVFQAAMASNPGFTKAMLKAFRLKV